MSKIAWAYYGGPGMKVKTAVGDPEWIRERIKKAPENVTWARVTIAEAETNGITLTKIPDFVDVYWWFKDKGWRNYSIDFDTDEMIRKLLFQMNF